MLMPYCVEDLYLIAGLGLVVLVVHFLKPVLKDAYLLLSLYVGLTCSIDPTHGFALAAYLALKAACLFL